MSPTLLSLASVLAVSLVSLAGVFLVFPGKQKTSRLLFPLVSFAAGGLLGDVFVHILPEIAEGDAEFFPVASLLIAGGIFLSFALEKIILWRHHHCLGCTEHPKVAGPMTLFGDAVHNVTDGMLIASSYLVDVRLGLATTIAVLLHEIPQEIGDCAIPLFSGYTKARAVFLNLLTALTAFLGAGIALTLYTTVPQMTKYILPLVAGNFLHIAVADLFPELHKQTRIQHAVTQLAMALAGVLLMYILKGVE